MTEKIDEAVAQAANNEADAAAAAAEAAKHESAEHIAAASDNATKAAATAAALAEVNAAKTINDNQEQLEWLKSHAQATENSLKELKDSQMALATSIPSMLEAQQTAMMEKLTGLLTPAKSQENEEPPKISPEEESAQEDARLEAEKKNKKPKTGPKHKANWI